MTFLAFMGWGTVYFAHASAAIQQQLREEVVQLRAAQDQLTAERDRAQAQLAVALPEVIAFTKRPEDLEAKAPVIRIPDEGLGVDSCAVAKRVGWCAMSRGGRPWRGLLII
jgi:hypothetical protein